MVTSRLSAEYPDAYNTRNTGFQASALSVHDELTRQARPTLLVLLAVTGFVLLLVSANIANLALARIIGRERELALRSALGAGRGRIARQLLTESTLLAVAGGALGLLVAWLVRDLLVAFTARFTPRADEIAIDGVVLAFTLGVAVFTGLLFGLLPALTRRSEATVKDAGQRTVGSRRLGARNALIAAQVTISFMLLVGAGLLVRSFIKLQQVDAGFRTDRVLTALVSLDFVKYATPVSRQALLPVGARQGVGRTRCRPGSARHHGPARSGGAVSRRLHRRGSGARTTRRSAASTSNLPHRIISRRSGCRCSADGRSPTRTTPPRRRSRSSTCRWRATFFPTSTRLAGASR